MPMKMFGRLESFTDGEPPSLMTFETLGDAMDGQVDPQQVGVYQLIRVRSYKRKTTIVEVTPKKKTP